MCKKCDECVNQNSANLSGNIPKRGNGLAQGAGVRFKTHLRCFLRTQIQTRKPAQCTSAVVFISSLSLTYMQNYSMGV